MTMSATAFTLDDITLEYSQEDYKPQSYEPKLDTWFEFKVNSAVVEKHANDYLAVKLECHALDGDGKKMFSKNIFAAMPVSIGEQIHAPSWAKGLWLQNIRPLYAEYQAFDKREKDPITGKSAYFKDGKPLKGKEYEEASIAGNKAIGALAKGIARGWVENGDGHIVDDFVNRTFFAKVKKDKSGQYTNIDKATASLPDGEEACYDKKQAMA